MPVLKKRLDETAVNLGLFDSIDSARRHIMAADVLVNGISVTKPGTAIRSDDVVTLVEKERFVSRGGLKLEAALDRFGIDPAGRVCLDVGASTGGFTDCLLQRGAAKVFAVDVGRGQLHWKLRNDPRVDSREGVNARFLDPADYQPPPSLAVGDVSFISLTLVLPPVFQILEQGGEAIFLIKPQFEAPRDCVGPGGIVRDESARLQCVEKIRNHVCQSGHFWIGDIISPITGRDGNVEYLFCARRA